MSTLTLALLGLPLAHAATPPLRLTTDTGGWNQGVAIAPGGEIVVVAGERIAVLAPDDGRVLGDAVACDVPDEDGVVFLDASTLLVICDSEARTYTWPGLVSTTITTFPRQVERAAVNGGRFAVAEDDFWIREGAPPELQVYDARSGARLDTIVIAAETESVAISPDGARIAWSVASRGTWIRTIGGHDDAQIPNRSLSASCLSFSPDSRALFARFRSFETSLLDLTTGATLGTWRVGSWLNRVVWTPAGPVGSGSDGATWFRLGAPSESDGSDEAMEGIAASPDGGTICAGDRSGIIRCWSDKPAAPYTAPAAPTVAAAPAAVPTPAAAAAPAPLEGTPASIQGAVAVLRLDTPAPARVGATGRLAAQLPAAIGQLRITGWLDVADVRVDRVDGDRWTLTVLNRVGEIRINDKPVDTLAGAQRLQLRLNP
jgi:hypothetical protein